MNGELLLTVVLLAATPDEATLRGWRSVDTPVTSTDLLCGNYSKSWRVAGEVGGIHVVPYDEAPVKEALPFVTELNEPQLADRHVRHLNGSWLVGLDLGEFGGGLWQFAEDGSDMRRVRPGPNAGHHPNDYLQVDNVKGFATVGEGLVVLMGLDHMTARSGRVFDVHTATGQTRLKLRAALDGEPRAWRETDEGLFVMTDTSMFRIPVSGPTLVIHRFSVDLSGLYPNSLASAPDGSLYIGMRRFVMRLQPEAEYREQWFTQESCARFRIRDLACECLSEE